MKRILTSGWLLPAGLAVAGAILIIVGQLDPGAEAPSLPPIVRPTADPLTPSPVATEAPTATVSADPTAVPTPTPLPEDVVAQQLEIPSVGINVLVQQSADEATDEFPPADAAFVLRGSTHPGHNENSYMFAHALNTLFKPLWNVQLGAEVLVRMSDGTVLQYVVTEIHPNVACPDPAADPALDPAALGVDPPLDLVYAGADCDEGVRWTVATGYERLTLQTSQGYNRNWGEFVVIADPVR